MRKGFTLVEMLVVVGIIAVLVGVGVSAFSGATKRAQNAHAQELVSEVATALELIHQNEGAWPLKILEKNNSEDGLDKRVSYELAKRNMMSLNSNDDEKETVGADRFGIVTPWAQKVIGRKVGKGVAKGTEVPSGGTIQSHVIRYAVDDDEDGIVNATVGGTSLRIRASAAAWCCGYDGVISPYPTGGGRSDDIYSWSRQQVVK